MLINLIHFFQERKILSLEEVAIHLKTDKETASGLLETLLKKGKVKRLNEDCKSCKLSCKNCTVFSHTMLFAWKE
jgi:3-hydroxyacyl-CoA dehydrogenase